jgi:hypothetical protein
MYKGFALLIALLLLLPCTTHAEINQAQGFNIDSSTVGVLSGTSTGSVVNFNATPITTFQMVTDGDGGTKYMQVSNSTLSQAAVTAGLYGDYGFAQNAVATGNQSQSSLPGYFSLGTQSQSLGAAFSQNKISNGAFGSTIAIQNFIGSGGQIITSPYGVNANFIAVGVDSSAGVLVNRHLSINRLGL